jgi:hypothetical protein
MVVLVSCAWLGGWSGHWTCWDFLPLLRDAALVLQALAVTERLIAMQLVCNVDNQRA